MTCREISDKMFTQALRGFVKVLRAVHKSSLGFPGHLITNFPNVMVLLVILSNSTGISRVFAKRWITKRWVTKRWVNLLFNGRRCPNLPKSLLYLARLRHCHKDTIIELKIAQIVTVLLVEQCRNQHSYHGWTMLLNEQCCSLLFQQSCSLLFQKCCLTLMKQQRLFKVVETGGNNIDRTSLFVIVIIAAQPCKQVVTVLMVEQWYNNIVIKAEQLCWQHCSLHGCSTTLFTVGSTTLFTLGSTTLFTPVDNRLCIFTCVVNTRTHAITYY